MKCSEIYPELENYLLSLKGVECEFVPMWNWKRFTVGGKLFAAICNDNHENATVNVKAQPDYNNTIRLLHDDISEGIYSYKSRWNTIKLTGTVPYEVVKDMCERGYNLALHSLPKKIRGEILEEYL